jgi:putative hydrolase of the HAD superfamily
MSDIKNIIFDLGGVILDIDKAAAIRRFKAAGISNIEEFLDPYRQRGVFRQLEEGSISRDGFYRALSHSLGRNLKHDDIDRGWFDFILPVQQSRLDFIDSLRKTYKVFLLSNTNEIIMSWALSAEFSPAGKPLDAYFDRLFLSYEMKCLKPDPEIFRKTIALAGIAPHETLFIDDSAANISAGSDAGFQTLLFTPQHSFDDIVKLLTLNS